MISEGPVPLDHLSPDVGEASMTSAPDSPHVVVVGGGNAALCAALTARGAGAGVTVLERAPRPFRGGNTRHTRNCRTAHSEADGYVTGPYLFDEFMRDLTDVTGDELDEEMAGLTIREAGSITRWMEAHGARWQAPLRGTLSLSRTNHFFLGGGKAHLNAYYLTAEDLGIAIHYDADVIGLRFDGRRSRGVTVCFGDGDPVAIDADAVVVASGGYEANREWLREGWGAAADVLVVRGTPYNDGTMLRHVLDAGARPVGDPAGAHAIAVDARAPLYDAGIITRLDAVPIGIVLNRDARRFSDEGVDIWPKRYASWGRLIAEQPDSVAYVLHDQQVATETIPGPFPPLVADTIGELATQLGLDPVQTARTVDEFNAACRVPNSFNLRERDGNGTEGIDPPKSNWARPLDHPPYYGYPLRPAITFTYLGVTVDESARIQSNVGGFDNVFAAGEIMAGNVLRRGYLAGFGMTIGTVWGRIAGREAARVAGAVAGEGAR
jgi:tricarballylate dehydrogenase